MDKIKHLIALATGEGTPVEEARTAAFLAVKRIVKLGAVVVMPGQRVPAPSAHSGGNPFDDFFSSAVQRSVERAAREREESRRQTEERQAREREEHARRERSRPPPRATVDSDIDDAFYEIIFGAKRQRPVGATPDDRVDASAYAAGFGRQSWAGRSRPPDPPPFVNGETEQRYRPYPGPEYFNDDILDSFLKVEEEMRKAKANEARAQKEARAEEARKSDPFRGGPKTGPFPARFVGRCGTCGAVINVGDMIHFTKGHVANCASCGPIKEKP